jgi:predicted transcriptional regulator
MTANRLKAMTSQQRAEAFRLIRDRGPISTSQVARELGVDVRELSYHVRKLRDFDCIEAVDKRRVRGVDETFYCSNDRNMIDI